MNKIHFRGFSIGLLACMMCAIHAYSQVDKQENTIQNTFQVPEGYERVEDDYADFFRNFPILLEEGRYYDGKTLPGLGITYAGIFDYVIGRRDLHQCADAAIYMRTQYLLESGRGLNDIKWHYTDGSHLTYGNFLSMRRAKHGKTSFLAYMENIWTYAGTWSIQEYETDSVNIKNARPGDIFVEGGFPGHAVTIVDMVENDEGKRLYMLAQSFMPAQSHHILLDINDTVWFDFDKNEKVVATPGWVFSKRSLKRFNN